MSIVCANCGGTHVTCQAFVLANTKEFIQFNDDAFDEGYCHHCQMNAQLIDEDCEMSGNNSEKKELWAFLYPSGEITRNASDDEIVAAYEHEDNDCREWPVEKLTPEEFACRVNDEAFADIKYWVRFIAV